MGIFVTSDAEVLGQISKVISGEKLLLTVHDRTLELAGQKIEDEYAVHRVVESRSHVPHGTAHHHDLTVAVGGGGVRRNMRTQIGDRQSRNEPTRQPCHT